MAKPIILINTKTYREATGKNAVKLAKACSRVAMQKKIPIILAVQATDISTAAKAASIPIWAQHVDNITYGRNTGFLTPEAAKAAGAAGTLLNHAEHKLNYKVLRETIAKCRKVKLKTMVCAATRKEAAIVAAFKPDYIAVEPPELIGTGISVSTAKPGIITNSVAAVRKVSKKIPVVCGAGITNGNDVKKAIELGSHGALAASGIVLARSQDAALRELLRLI